MNLDLKMMYSMPMYVSMYLANQINRFSEGGGKSSQINIHHLFSTAKMHHSSQVLGGLVSTMFYYFHPYLGGFMIQFDQMRLQKPPTKQGLDSTVKPVVPATAILSGSYQTLRYLEASRKNDAARLVRGDVQRRVGKCPLFRCWGRCWDRWRKTFRMSSGKWKLEDYKVGKSLGEQYILKHKRVYSWWFVG